MIYSDFFVKNPQRERWGKYSQPDQLTNLGKKVVAGLSAILIGLWTAGILTKLIK